MVEEKDLLARTGLVLSEHNVRKLFGEDCQSGSAKGCLGLAAMWISGKGGVRDARKARDLFKKSCEMGIEQGCATAILLDNSAKNFEIGGQLSEEKCQNVCSGGDEECCTFLDELNSAMIESARKSSEIRRTFQSLCVWGSSAACYFLGEMFRKGDGGSVDKELAIILTRQAVEIVLERRCNEKEISVCIVWQMLRAGLLKSWDKRRYALEFLCGGGNETACFLLGGFYFQGWGGAEDFVKAKDLFTKICDSGNTLACFISGAMSHEGVGGVQDKQAARTFYEKACTSGEPLGCAYLGMMYERGDGAEKDFSKARDLYEKACGGGDTDSCFDLGNIWLAGISVPKNKSKATKYFRMACDKEDLRGCMNLGYILKHETGEKNKQKGIRFYEKACEGGIGLGCYNLGAIYEKGRGVKKDRAKAQEYFNKACPANVPTDFSDGCADYGMFLLTEKKVEQAIGVLKTGCSRSGVKSSGYSCYYLGNFYKFKLKDDKQSLDYFTRACSLDVSAGCIEQATILFENGEVGKASEIAAAALDMSIVESMNGEGIVALSLADWFKVSKNCVKEKEFRKLGKKLLDDECRKEEKTLSCFLLKLRR